MASAAARRAPEVRRVLVVDDDQALCELVTDMLRIGGFDADCVHSDRGAYERLARPGAFDALLVDVNLGPGTTGYDVARFARQADPRLAIVYVSGQTSRASFKAFGVPGSGFLEKPFTAEELQDAVELALGD